MDYSDTFVELYHKALMKEIKHHNVSDEDIKTAMKVVRKANLSISPDWEHNFDCNNVLNYDIPAQRCAYIHKYAMCNTGMVHEELMAAMESNNVIEVSIRARQSLKLCCLGGGPGTDVIGVLTAILERIGTLPCSVTVIDSFQGWERTFKTIWNELRCKDFLGLCLPGIIDEDVFKCKYLVSDLLHEVEDRKPQIRTALLEADLVTMVKFVSSSACQGTRKMIKKTLRRMKPGAMLLFIDNAKGGFYQMMEDEALDYGMVAVYGPYTKHYYENQKYAVKRFNSYSQSRTEVAIGIWKKPGLTLENLDPNIRLLAERVIREETEGVQDPLLQALPRFESPPHSRRLAQLMLIGQIQRSNPGEDINEVIQQAYNQPPEVENPPEEAGNQSEEVDNQPEEEDEEDDQTDEPVESRVRWPLLAIVCVFWLLISYLWNLVGLSIFAWVVFRFGIDKSTKHKLEHLWLRG